MLERTEKATREKVDDEKARLTCALGCWYGYNVIAARRTIADFQDGINEDSIPTA